MHYKIIQGWKKYYSNTLLNQKLGNYKPMRKPNMGNRGEYQGIYQGKYHGK